MLFETHAHYEDEKFDEDREVLLEEVFAGGIGQIVNVGSTLDTCKKSIELASKYENIYAAVGVHPSEIHCFGDFQTVEELRNTEGWQQLLSFTKEKKIVAIGEVGLDYYWDKEPAVQARQREAFVAQLELAKELSLPIIVHSRDAAKDTMDILKDRERFPLKGVIHCYSYSVEQALEYVKMGYYIGVGGVVTFKNAKVLKEVVKAIPLERIVIETDCPYMAPEPHRGSRNYSLYLSHVVDKIAELKGISAKEVEDVTFKNACDMYGLTKI